VCDGVGNAEVDYIKQRAQKLRTFFSVCRGYLLRFLTDSMTNNIEIRECTTLDQLAACVQLQRDVFALPEVEISPVRHFIVTRNAGGFTLGAWDGDRLAGFVLSVPAFLGGERAFYSHMTGVHPEYQGRGIGALLKWAQRGRSLSDGVKFIKWTFEPVKARNAYFNLEKLGAAVFELQPNFYGTDYATSSQSRKPIGLASDRLFAEWDLDSPTVAALAAGDEIPEEKSADAEIVIMNDWLGLVEMNAEAAKDVQMRVRGEFTRAFASGMKARRFRRDKERPAYLLYRS
jgi:predicted GNAT superfamily acetyltransferase